MKAEQDKVNSLVEYVQGLMNKENGKELYLKHKSDIEQVTPQEVFEIFHLLLQKGEKPKELLVFLDKVINVFYKSLANYLWEWPEKNSFMDFLLQENHALNLGTLEVSQDITEVVKLEGERRLLQFE